MTKKSKQLSILDIGVLVLLLIGISISFVSWGKIAKTSVNLFLITAQVNVLEEDARNGRGGNYWTEEMIECYDELQEDRNTLYNSDDLIVNWFSNQNTLVKLIVLFASTFLCLCSIYAIFMILVTTANSRKRKRKKR